LKKTSVHGIFNSLSYIVIVRTTWSSRCSPVQLGHRKQGLMHGNDTTATAAIY